MNDFRETIKNVQLQKVIGELNCLKMCYYNPLDSNDSKYKEVNALIKGMIQELENELG